MKRLLPLAAGLIALATSLSAAVLGDDGLHKAPWMRDTFKDLREDLAEANAEGRRLMVMIEQRGCIYCTKMHEEVYPDPAIDPILSENFYVVQINMFGDFEVTDFDGEILTEKEAVLKWGAMYTPTILFFPEEVSEGVPAHEARVAYVPGALGVEMFGNMLNWVLEHGYESGENFQKYHARKFNERRQ